MKMASGVDTANGIPGNHMRCAGFYVDIAVRANPGLGRLAVSADILHNVVDASPGNLAAHRHAHLVKLEVCL
jgi:hypothetical protein